jgi:hypothetical protein
MWPLRMALRHASICYQTCSVGTWWRDSQCLRQDHLPVTSTSWLCFDKPWIHSRLRFKDAWNTCQNTFTFSESRRGVLKVLLSLKFCRIVIKLVVIMPTTVAARSKACEPSSPDRILGPWVRIPLKAWMSVCVFCVCVVLCVGSGFATGWSPIRGVL